MPALPVFGDGGGFVGRIEIERETDGEDAGEAEGHVGIAGEIEVELHGVDDDAGDGGKGGKRAGARKGEIGLAGKLVGDEDFFGEAHEKPGEAEGDVGRFEGEAAGGRNGGERLIEVAGFVFRAGLAELRHHLFVVEDGAGDEVGKEGDEEEIGEKVLALGLTLGEVDEIRDLGKGEERNA